MKLFKKNMTVVDLGAGDGYISRAVAKFAKKVIAVDISGKMLRELGKKAETAGLKNIDLLESDGQDLPIPASSTDVVCANMYLHHIQEPAIAVKEINRILKPGGKVFLADFAKHGNTELKERMHDTWPGFTSGELETWFSESSFIDIKIEKLTDKVAAGHEAKESILVLTAAKGSGR